MIDLHAIRRRARAHWNAGRHTEATLSASFDVCQLLAHIDRLERRLTRMQAERAAHGDGKAARAGEAILRRAARKAEAA